MSLLRSLEQIFSTYLSRLSPDQSGRRAAVLVPLVASPDGMHLLLTKRTDTVEHHKGQISFPGGAADDTDVSLIGTALREAFEEIGLPSSAVRVLGALDEVRTPSGFLITPIVGVISEMPVLLPNPAEVREIIRIPFAEFLDTRNVRTEVRRAEGTERLIHTYNVGAEPVWGATAFIIHRLIALLRDDGWNG